MSDDLKPCPFCGHDAKVCGEPVFAGRYGFYVACTNCNCLCRMGENYDRDAIPDHAFFTEEEAKKAWNRRANFTAK